MQKVPDHTACISYRLSFLSHKEKKRLAYLWSTISTSLKISMVSQTVLSIGKIVKNNYCFCLSTVLIKPGGQRTNNKVRAFSLSVEMHILLADCFSFI